MSLAHDIAARAARLLEPEAAHRAGIAVLKAGLGPYDDGIDDPCLAVEVSGLRLRNCVGLAAGFDKNAEVPDAMLRAGFGFVECGTVTPQPQSGNPHPRVFRLEEDRAVINRLGFNNEGLEAFARRLALRKRRTGVTGANIGANKDSSDRAGDYVTGLRRLWGLADYFTVNISSPNTPGLRDLQERAALDDLLGRLAEARSELAVGRDYPLFVKVAPDLTDRQIEDVVEAILASGVNGIVVGNTTLSRPAGLRSSWAKEAGGLSGAPLTALSTQVLARFHAAHTGRLVMIGAGGVANADDAFAKIRAGACVVQLYSALVYQGPGLVRRLKRDLARRVRAEGFSSVIEALGTACG